MRGLTVCLLVSAAAAGVLYRSVEPVSLNDTIVIAGADLDTATGIQLCDRSAACVVVPLAIAASTTVRASRPDTPLLDAASTLNATVVDATSAPLLWHVLNLPQVSWYQSSGATPSFPGAPAVITGSVLRLMGRSLAWMNGSCLPFTQQPSGAIAPGVRVLLSPHRGASDVVLAVSFASCYRIDAYVPDDGSVPEGTYDVRVDNGLRGPGVDADGTVAVLSGITVGPDVSWPAATFTVNITAGCASIAGCIAVAGAAGGGTVLVPPGVWNVWGSQLYFPDRVALVGAGRGVTTIRWPPFAQVPVAFDPHFPNTSEGEPIISGAAPGAQWRMSDLTLDARAPGGLGYQPPLGTDLIGLRAGSVGVRLERLDIVYDLTATPAIQIGNAFSTWGAADVRVVDVSITHRGSCSAQWPRNCALYVTNSSNVELRGVTAHMGCQAYAIESSSNTLFVDSSLQEMDVFAGIGSSNGGAEVSTIDPPHVSEHHYYGNNTYVGNGGAANRWESFTTDGGADSVYNASIAGQGVVPNGSATLTLLPPGVTLSVFFYTWAPGFSVAVIRGPGVGQIRRLLSVSADGLTAMIDAPFSPPLSPGESIISITGYRGGYTLEGNAFVNGTCVQMYGQCFDSVVSGNVMAELYGQYAPDGSVLYPRSATTTVAGVIGGGGNVYATAYQLEAFNIWERNAMTCASMFQLTAGFLQGGGVPGYANTTLNFAHVVRRNTLLGMRVLNVSYSTDSVVEHNTLGGAYCAYASAFIDAPSVFVGNTSNHNIGMLFLP